jgi:hypothetical protein
MKIIFGTNASLEITRASEQFINFKPDGTRYATLTIDIPQSYELAEVYDIVSADGALDTVAIYDDAGTVQHSYNTYTVCNDITREMQSEGVTTTVRLSHPIEE